MALKIDNMNKIIWGIAILGGGYLLYKYARNFHISPKQKYILSILGKNYQSFDEGFLKSWADAVMSNSNSFTYQNSNYATSNGFKIK
jgi:hypothetical protein